jgi:hypothetical protein
MNSIRKRTTKLRAEVKKRMTHNPFIQDQLSKLRQHQLKTEKTMMEMWENYLTFNRLDF